MSLPRLIWLGAGAAAGSYLAYRRRVSREAPPPPLEDVRGKELEPRTVKLDGGHRVAVVSAGSGPALLLVPGLSGDKEVFQYQVPAFSADYRVIATDLRDTFEAVDARFDQFARDLGVILDAFEESEAIVLGLSFGGPIAMRFASLFPERVTRLVLTNTLTRLDLSHVGLNKTLLIPFARLSTRYLPAFLVRRLARLWGRLGVWVYDPSPGNERIIDYELETPIHVPREEGEVRMDTFKEVDLRDELKRIDQPALVISGGADSYTPAGWQREIADLLPNSTYVEIADAGHLGLISHAEEFNRVVLDWLKDHQRSHAPSPHSAETS